MVDMVAERVQLSVNKTDNASISKSEEEQCQPRHKRVELGMSREGRDEAKWIGRWENKEDGRERVIIRIQGETDETD